jgi:exopolysaccharide biosynthesis polyprenyl glycosylphosphotransferase
MARIVPSNDALPQPQVQYTSAGIRPEMTSGATGQMTKVISQRRSHRQQWHLMEILVMLIVDVLLLHLAFWIAYTLRFNVISQNFVEWLKEQIFDTTQQEYFSAQATFAYTNFVTMEISIIVGMIFIFALRRLYHIRLTGNWFRQMWTIVTSSTMVMAFVVTFLFFFQNPHADANGNLFAPNSRLMVPFIWGSVIVVLCVGRLVIAGIVGMLYRLGIGETRVLVVGSGRLGKMVMQSLAANPNLGYSVVGFLHDLTEQPSDFGRFKMLGTIDDMRMVILSMQVDEVIIALPGNMHRQAIRSVKLCERLGTSFKLIPDLYEVNLSRIDMDAIEGIPLLGIKQVSLNTPQRIVTRAIDISISLLVLILGSPLFLFLALAVRFSSPGSIIYKQERVGLNGKHFFMYKFRSMYKDADQRLAQLLCQNEAQGPIFKMRYDPRVTPIGRFIRRTSLDEIPQFVNVLKGEMSLVGPRPPLPREVAQYEEWQRGRLAIKPGLTGLWQVRGRSNISFDEGVLMDLYYIENWSLRLYIQVLMRTVPAVLFSRGAY